MPLASLRGGAERTLLHLLDHQAATGLRWTVVFFEDGPLVEAARDRGVDVEILHTGRLRQPVRYLRAVRRLARLFRRRQVDLVLSWMGKAHLYGGPAARWAGRPALWFQHAFPADVHWMDRLATLLPAAGVLACSRAGAALQESLWPHRPTTVVHPGVDLDTFSRERLPARAVLRAERGLPQEGPVVGMVGRLQRWKGMHVFIEAVARLRADFPALRGVIVGGTHEHEPEYPARLRHQIDRLGLEDAILMTGFQSNPAAWMATFDVFVHASDREPFGLVVVEAMGLGLPVVASDTAGPTEVIAAEQTGLFAPFGDDARLADQIRRYLEAPAWAQAIGRAARERALDFTPLHFATRVATAIRAHTPPVPATTGAP
jgi:glycosyltransferase involved in cell wall biosynthesis